MSVKKKTVTSVINKYLSENESVNLKLESLKERLTETDEIFKWRHFEQYLYTFIQGEKDIEDFYSIKNVGCVVYFDTKYNGEFKLEKR